MKKKFTTYNPYARLPKAQDGMNVRGNRNQLAQKETTTKNVGTWFEDAGKWVLNSLAAIPELISGTNFYDPDMAHSGWQQFDDVSEGVVKGVGDALGYVYGGPAYGALKAGVSGIADAAGAKDDVAPMSVQYGGKIPKAQNSFTTSNTMNFANQAQLDNYNNIMGQFQSDPRFMEAIYGNGSQGTMAGGGGGQTSQMPGVAAGGQPSVGQTPQTLPQQPSNIPTNAGTYGDPTKGQGWSDAVMDAASDPAGATANMIGGFANAGKNPVVAKDTGVYQEITKNTDSHPGSLAQSMGDIITGVDPTEYAYTKKHKDNQMRMQNANKQMRAVGNIQYGGRLYQMGGTVSNPYMKTHIAQENAKSQGGMENMAAKVGAAIQHAGGVVGESLSGMGMGGGGGMGGMMGGGGQGGGGMGGMMDMFSGMMGMFQQNGGRVPVRKGKSPYIATHYYQNGEKVTSNPGSKNGTMKYSDLTDPTFNEDSALTANTYRNVFPDISRMDGLWREVMGNYDESGSKGLSGGREFVESNVVLTNDQVRALSKNPNYLRELQKRQTLSKYDLDRIKKAQSYQNGDEVRPEDMPRKATAADLKRIDEWFKNTEMIETPYSPTDSTYNPYYNIMNEIDSLSATPQGSNEDFLDQPFQYGGIPKAQRGKKVLSYVDSLEAHNSGSELLEHFLNRYPEVELDTIQGPFENNTKGHFNGGTRENMKPTAKIVRKDRRDNDPNNTNLFDGNLVADLYDKPTNIPKGYKEEYLRSIYNQNGGRIPKAQMGGGMMSPGLGMIQKLIGGLGGGGGQGGGGMDMSGMMEKMQNMDPEQWKAIQGMFKDGFSAEGLGNAIGGSAGEGIAGIVGGFMGGGGATKQNGGRLEKTSDLPMDMEGFTDLEPGFNRSNTIEINSGNNHSDLNDPHTPLNVPVPSFDGQGNAMTENVQILAEKGEFARKDPETEAVTIFSKNLKTKDSSGKRTNYAKIAEKLGKKEDRLTEQAKNPFDDIADASIQRALNNVKNKFIRLEEEQKVAKEVKEEEDRMDLMQLAKNGGRITKKNTYRMGGKVKTLSEYQKELIGMDDQGQMPMAQNGSVSSDTADDAYFADPTVEDNTFSELFEDEEARKKAKEEPLKDKEKQKEFNKRYREERRQERKDERSGKQEQRHLERERRKLRKRGGEDVSDLAQEIAELPGGGSEAYLDPYTNEGARKADELLKEQARKQKQQEEGFSWVAESNDPNSPEFTGPKIQEEEYSTAPKIDCPPCKDGTIPTKDKEGNCSPCPEEQKQQQRRASSGDSAINDYINNLRGINADVENRFEPYRNFFEDYGRDSENIARNAINDLPEWYMDRASQLASANVNSLENQIRNMGQSMGTSGYLAQMQAAKNKELAANQGYAAQAVGQREQQLGKLSALMAQNELYDRTGAEQSFDRTQEARDAIDAAKYDTEKNILTGRLAQTREDNAARRNELLDSQMQWMYNNNRTQYDEEGNPVNPDPADKQYGGKIKRDMYEYGSRVKRERQMKSDKAINEFRSFMRGFNKK